MGELAEIIQTLGFPVAVCIACFYFINTIIKENREDSKKREELLFTRIGEISKTLSDVANTLALIDERIEKLEEKENRIWVKIKVNGIGELDY